MVDVMPSPDTEISVEKKDRRVGRVQIREVDRSLPQTEKARARSDVREQMDFGTAADWTESSKLSLPASVRARLKDTSTLIVTLEVDGDGVEVRLRQQGVEILAPIVSVPSSTGEGDVQLVSGRAQGSALRKLVADSLVRRIQANIVGPA